MNADQARLISESMTSTMTAPTVASRIEPSVPDASTVSLRGFEVDALFMKVKLDGRPTVTFPVTTRGSE